jgi:hypothetical protein
MLSFYGQKLLSDDLNVGPTFKAKGFRIDYSGSRELVVLTSGRMFSASWLRVIRYLLYRLRYNLKMLPVGQDVTERIHRGSDNVRKPKPR